MTVVLISCSVPSCLFSIAATIWAVEHAHPLAELSPPRATASPWRPKGSGPEADHS